MNKKILTIALLSFIALPLASCGDPKEDFTYVKYESDIVINNYIGNNKKVVVPELIEEVPVTTIASHAFKDLDINSVELPSSIKTIEDGAFQGSNIETITLPADLYEIPDNCFFDCSNLSYLKLPSTLGSIGENAFYNCKNLKSIIIPESVIYIDANAFKGCMDTTIYCEVMKEPLGWHKDWNSSYCYIVWNYK